MEKLSKEKDMIKVLKIKKETEKKKESCYPVTD